VREKRRVVILNQEFPHEGAYLGVCFAHVCCRYRIACRNLCPDHGDRTDDGTGYLDIDRSVCDNQEEEIVEIAPREKKVQEVLYGSIQLNQAQALAP
jgi:hypothetical protein